MLEKIFLQDDADFQAQCRYGVHGNGTHVQMQGLGSWQTLDTSMGRWYRSKDNVAGKNPYFGYLSNKKWPLNEDITKHLLYFAQVRDCSVTTTVYIIFDIGCQPVGLVDNICFVNIV